MKIDPRFVPYLLENLCRGGNSWYIVLNGNRKFFNETKLTEERVLFLEKNKDIRSLVSDLKYSHISEFSAHPIGFSFIYRNPGREQVQEIRIEKS